MIWLEAICLVLSIVTTSLAIYIMVKQRALSRHIDDARETFRRLSPRVERLEKKSNSQKKEP